MSLTNIAYDLRVLPSRYTRNRVTKLRGSFLANTARGAGAALTDHLRIHFLLEHVSCQSVRAFGSAAAPPEWPLAVSPGPRRSPNRAAARRSEIAAAAIWASRPLWRDPALHPQSTHYHFILPSREIKERKMHIVERIMAEGFNEASGCSHTQHGRDSRQAQKNDSKGTQRSEPFETLARC